MNPADRVSAVFCPSCRAPLGEGTLEASGGERSPWGDDYCDELHRCGNCGVWAVVTVVDRFCGPEEMLVHGPISAEEAAERRTEMKR